MTEVCISTVVENRLVCRIENADWFFFIRRSDRQVYVPFSEFHKKQNKPADLKQYLPTWRTLHWRTIKNSMAGKSESYAKDVEFSVNIYSAEGSTKSHQEVLEAFLMFMSDN